MTLAVSPAGGSRVDARAKATGATTYAADVSMDGLLYAGVVRSPFPHAEIVRISAADALCVDGVVSVVSAVDLTSELCGRRVRDMPLLAAGKARFAGEPVAVVLATGRLPAEEAAGLVDVTYRELPAVLDPVEALQPSAARVHDAPWSYDGAVVGPDDPANLQSQLVTGSLEAASAELARAAYRVARSYRTPAGHQGYLEPQCWTAVPAESGGVRLHGTAKAPYRLREQVARTLGKPADLVHIEPAPIGGDFGGKGGVVDATLCAALALLARQPVRLALRSSDDLTATDARHPALIEVQLGCNERGQLTAMIVDAVFDGGAYAAIKPIPSVNLHGMAEAAVGYRLHACAVRSRIAYTNRIPKGHMRAPGAPQVVFAMESAVDELAHSAGIPPAELRRRSLLSDGDRDAYGHPWPEARGTATLSAAVSCRARVQPPGNWKLGSGLAVYARATSPPATTSLRLVPGAAGEFCVEVPFPETGTGSHTLVRNEVAEALHVDPDRVRVRQVSSSSLPYDPGVGASRVTVGLTAAVRQLVAAWHDSGGTDPVTVQTEPGSGQPVLSYCAQVARVAVDPATGQVRLLELVTAVDVAAILRPASHQLQLDGGAVMGFGFACLEDLLEQDGQVWAGSLADFRLPTTEDVPVLQTVLVEGGRGVGPANVKAVGELANVPVAAAVANAVADAVGVRVRALPITAERVYRALHGEDRGNAAEAHP
ncbi:MAG: xanthine dehydrogenase family protein molybdopterin-binding subunit [Streptosporangiaceae bacterium]